MKNKGFTLTELVMALVITTLLLFITTMYFVAEYRLRSAINDKVTLVRETRIAMNHMVRILRFAQPGNIVTQADQITATIQGGAVSSIPIDTIVQYTRRNTGTVNPEHSNVIEYTRNGATTEIARNITAFDPDWNDPELEILITVDDAGQTFELQTEVRPLGE